MSLDNSSIQHPLPGDLQARVENALNLVTSLEAEQARLAKMCGVETQKINALHEEKKYLESQILSLKAEIESIIQERDKKREDIKALQNQRNMLEDELEDLEKGSSSLKAESEGINKSLDSREKDIAKKEADIIKRQASLEKKESDHGAKVERLKEALK